MKITSEEQLLSKDVRVQLIKEMLGNENLARKQDMLRRHEIYRDQNRKWVIEALSKEGYKETTLAQMQNRAANLSIARRIVDKLARTYIGGVKRKAADDTDQKALDAQVKCLGLDSVQKKLDRYKHLFKNTTVQFIPVRSSTEKREDGVPLYDIQARVFAPWQYDVIEDAADPTRAMAYILTDFPEQQQFLDLTASTTRGAQGYRDGSPAAQTDGVDAAIADDPADKGKDAREFIVWTANYHFCFNEKGDIIPEKSPGYNDGLVPFMNPIGKLPFRDLHEDQDGFYWAKGGDDVVEGSVLVNKLLTDGNYISFVQGWGQLVVTAPEIPKKLVGGPDNALMFETKPDHPAPQVFFASSNPQTDKTLNSVYTLLAMLLTTNGLSPRTVSVKLDASNVASGISMLIENSDVDEQTKDGQTAFHEAEPDEFEITNAWAKVYGEKKLLTKKWTEAGLMQKPREVSLIFLPAAPPVTEKERLEAMKLRKDLGIATLSDLVKLDNPELTDEQVKAKVAELEDEKKSNAEQFGVPQQQGPDGKPMPPKGPPQGAPNGKDQQQQEQGAQD